MQAVSIRFFHLPAYSMILSIGPMTFRETLLLRVANLLMIGEAPVIGFTASMIRFAVSMMLVGTSMKFSRLANFIEVVFDRFVMQ